MPTIVRARLRAAFLRLQNTIQLGVYTRQYKCTKQVVNSGEMDADEVIDNWSDIESAVSSDQSDESTIVYFS